MAKKYDISEVKIKEIRIGVTQGKLDGLDYYDISVLYQKKDITGELLPPQWSDPIKDLKGTNKSRITKMLQTAGEQINSIEGIV